MYLTDKISKETKKIILGGTLTISLGTMGGFLTLEEINNLYHNPVQISRDNQIYTEVRNNIVDIMNRKTDITTRQELRYYINNQLDKLPDTLDIPKYENELKSSEFLKENATINMVGGIFLILVSITSGIETYSLIKNKKAYKYNN